MYFIKEKACNAITGQLVFKWTQINDAGCFSLSASAPLRWHSFIPCAFIQTKIPFIYSLSTSPSLSYWFLKIPSLCFEKQTSISYLHKFSFFMAHSIDIEVDVNGEHIFIIDKVFSLCFGLISDEHLLSISINI